MAEKSSIEWTDATWNPVRGCSMAKGSETGGCLNCYAARMAARNLPEMKSPTTGKPFARIMDSGPRWTGEVELIEKALTIPLHWSKPRRIFVNSMSDLFHEKLTDGNLLGLFAVMGNSHIATGCEKTHTFQILTKRPERMLDFMSRLRWRTGIGFLEFGAKSQIINNMPYLDTLDPWQSLRNGGNPPKEKKAAWVPPQIWLGVSVENQATADARIPLLLRTPAAVRFVSYEPALGPVTFFGPHGPTWNQDRSLDWIIVGGESGPGSRPFDLKWARFVVKQCKAARTACFVKQLGANPITGPNAILGKTVDDRFVVGACRGVNGNYVSLLLNDRKGGDWSEWPEDLRVREYPEAA